uniref:Isoprenylcysteine carboxylmethyltransferase family protein n=1 Tax=candidate division WOR-3 bacterium TaxID=2052148 RepID=A0A7C3J6K5_UNCW3
MYNFLVELKKIFSIIFFSLFLLTVISNTIIKIKKEKIKPYNFDLKTNDGKLSFLIFVFTDSWIFEVFRNIFFYKDNFLFKDLIPFYFVKTLSSFIFIFGFIIYIISLFDLNSEWVIGTDSKKVKKLVKSGAYSLTRNPMYIFFIIFYFSVFLLIGSIEMLIFFLSSCIIFYLMILNEEKELEEKFKNEYLDYKSKVKRFF